MKQFSKILFVAIFLGSFMLSSQASAQVTWKKPLHFLYKGTMTGNGKTLYITMGFYWDNNDGKVAGEYYYGSGKNGTIDFDGYYNAKTKTLAVSEFITNDNGERRYVRNTFEGKSAGGWYKGRFIIESEKKVYNFAVKLIKVYKR
ncbi:hypothetical protein BKI52_21825 [marine bacterium AO1-C]|nr:hypothetical protein BKI52_21825 [marine bacterium AO1-C]